MEKSKSQSSFWKQKKSSKPNLFKKWKKEEDMSQFLCFCWRSLLLRKKEKNIASKMKSRSYYYDNAGYGVSSPDTKLVRHLTKINAFKVNFSISFKLNDNKFSKKGNFDFQNGLKVKRILHPRNWNSTTGIAIFINTGSVVAKWFLSVDDHCS